MVIEIGFKGMRERPAMFLDPVTFIKGYGLGQAHARLNETKDPFALPSDFHDWVACRLHFYEPTSGWCNMIAKRLGDGPDGFDRFFTLLDEYHARVPTVVAKLSGYERTYLQYSGGRSASCPFPRRSP